MRAAGGADDADRGRRSRHRPLAFLTFDLQPDDSVVVKTKIRCNDSNKADTDDYDESELPPFTLAPGGHSHWNIYVDGDNYAQA